MRKYTCYAWGVGGMEIVDILYVECSSKVQALRWAEFALPNRYWEVWL